MRAYRKRPGINWIEEVEVQRMNHRFVFYLRDGATVRERLRSSKANWYSSRQFAVATEHLIAKERVKSARKELAEALACLDEFEEREGLA